MMNDHYHSACRTVLPAINETFPQFGRPISLLSPLDLSLRPSNTAIPITPPSTPSPPRKRQRLMSDESYLWRPHVIGMPPATATAVSLHSAQAATGTGATSTTVAATAGNYFLQQLTYTYRDELAHSSRVSNVYKGNYDEIPEIHSTVQHQQHRRPPQQQEQQEQRQTIPTIYVDDETIELTEDEDETDVNSSLDFISERGTIDDVPDNVNDDGDGVEKEHNEEEEEEEYVDILSNDDDDLNPLRATLQSQRAALVEQELQLEQSGKVLTRNKLVYENEDLHNRAVHGLAKLFERDFHPPSDADRLTEAATLKVTYDTNRDDDLDKTYTDLSNCTVSSGVSIESVSPNRSSGVAKKTERKRTKLRKHAYQDEETISPVSGTIIRKLRDDEELVVRKGDIDPAFNVVEITEEAKAILASIDNKIGAYLCQLCRTLYDDAFMLAQHRCPRIVHIEYKCSECEKVFNCPANLASHRRWHKPKSQDVALSNGQGRKRPAAEQDPMNVEKSLNAESDDGIFPCHQCGKTFRRHAYLKKHQASHQMLENLKSLEIFRNTSHPNTTNFLPPPNASQTTTSSGYEAPMRPNPQQVNHYGVNNSNNNMPSTASSTTTPTNHHAVMGKTFTPMTSSVASATQPQRFGAMPFPGLSEQRRFYSLGELYLSQHLERSSAFQYVQANHLRNLAGNFMPRPLMNHALMSTMAVK